MKKDHEHTMTKEAIAEILNNELFSTNFDDIFELLDSNIKVSDLDDLYSNLLTEKTVIKNIGIDLPLWFGDVNYKNKTMVVALDPKRNDKSNHDQNKKQPPEISVGSIFSLHTENGKNTGKNCYWEFISNLSKDKFVYITDIYKIYYETKDHKGINIVSNKDKEFIEKSTEIYQKNKQILKKEISIIKPNQIITLGKEAKEGVIKILDISVKKNDIKVIHEGIEIIFLPHISTTVTQSIKTIGDLFKGLGIVTNNPQLTELGENILKNKSLENILA